MADEERERQIDRREAFEKGVQFALDQLNCRADLLGDLRHLGDAVVKMNTRSLMAEINRRYPLPTVTRPRVVRDEIGSQFRVVPRAGEGMMVLQWQSSIDRDNWREGGPTCIDAERAGIIADLFANPTEEVGA